jgi:hypothetical protein
MISINVFQYVDEKWNLIGSMSAASIQKAYSILDALQESIEKSPNKLLPLRLDIMTLVSLNLEKGPVRFEVTIL